MSIGYTNFETILILLQSLSGLHIEKIIKNLRQGKREAFNEIFHLFSDRIFKLARKMHLNHEESEEIVQDVFLIIWEKRKFLDVDKDFRAYIFKIAKSLIIKNFRRKSLYFAYQEYVQSEPITFHSDTESLVDYQNLLELLENEISRLPESRRQIFLLSRRENLSNDEIARQLGISRRTVENQIYRTLKLLKDRIQSKDVLILIPILFTTV